MTYKQLLDAGTKMLEAANISNASTDAWILMQFVFKISRLDYLMNPCLEADPEGESLYKQHIFTRTKHYPLHILQMNKTLWGWIFMLMSMCLFRVRIRRCSLKLSLGYVKDEMSVLDMCTGSGCIITTLSANRRLSRAVGVDLSEDAIKVAERNACYHRQEKIEFVHSDLFENVQGTFDVIVSNPPYIPSEEIDGLMTEVCHHEPRMALDGSSDGLLFYRKIIRSSTAVFE